MNCLCGSQFEVRLAREEQYREFKRVLDVGKHPAFIGQDCFTRLSRNGGALFYFWGGEALAVSLINPHTGILLALNVHPAHRSHGLGRAIMGFLIPNFARVIEERVGWFESLGYVRVGRLKKGQTLNTQVMARGALFTLAGKLQKNLAKCADRQRFFDRMAGDENIASNAAQKMVLPDPGRQKKDGVSRQNGILAREAGGKKLR